MDYTLTVHFSVNGRTSLRLQIVLILYGINCLRFKQILAIFPTKNEKDKAQSVTRDTNTFLHDAKITHLTFF